MNAFFRFLYLSVLTSIAVASVAAEMIPFVVPWNDNAQNATNLSTTLHQPAGSLGRVVVDENGHFCIESDRIRFFGVNIAAASCFPLKENATPIAQRMAKFGLNVARFHHMDNGWENSLIDYDAGGSTTLNQEHLDRLDNFIAELKAAGVYINLNLLCSREFKSADGLAPGVDAMDWKTTHVLAMFDEGARNLQKQFAIDILTHINPYTGLSYIEDPAIAFVEINNENGLLHQWHSGTLDSLPQYYEHRLQEKWNIWLQGKYANTEALQTAWGSIDKAVGPNLVSDFQSNSWSLEEHGVARATLTRTATEATLSINTVGSASWHVQFNHPNIHFVKDEIYTLRFSIRSSSNRKLSVSLMQAHDPWNGLGFSADIATNNTWQEFEYLFIAANEDTNARLNFGGLGAQVGIVEIKDLTFQTGGKMGGLRNGISLENGNIPIIHASSRELSGTMKDWFEFALDLESEYWADMKAFIRGIGYPGIVWGTTIMNTMPHTQTQMDAMDSHAYWQHPNFIGGDWNPTDWTVGVESMVNDRNGGVIPNLSWQRVRGKPHNVTEYQHCFPNAYTSEGPLFAAAYGSLQDWDGIYLFAYGGGEDNWDRGHIEGFFDTDQHPTKMVNAALASLLFRRFDIQPAQHVLNIPFDAATNLELAQEQGTAWNVGDSRHLHLGDKIPLIHRVQMDLTPATNLPLEDEISQDDIEYPMIEQAVITSDTGELVWDHRIDEKSVVTLNTEKAKAVWGYQNGNVWAWPGFHMQVYNAQQDWCTAAAVITEGESFRSLANKGGRGLIVTTGNTENTNMGWTSVEKNSVGNAWGTTPTLVENLSGLVVFEVPPSSLQVWSLDTRGNRKAQLPILEHELGSRVNLGGENGSLWYEFIVTP